MCKRTIYVEETVLLQNQSYDTDVRVQGHEFDGLIIDNCTFDGGELYISDVDSVIVRNCTFRNQKKNGMRIGFGGEASHILVENSSFMNIGSNGVDSHENAPNCIIRNNYFENCAQSDVGSAMAQPHHCIYWKGKNVQIVDNQFNATGQNYGNAISHRSSGLIARNKVYGSPKYGIMYYANHPGEDTLIIENNFVSNCANGIGITTPNMPEYHNETVIVRFNSVYNCDTYSLYAAKDFEGTTNIQFYGNVVVSPTGEYLKTFYEGILDSLNLKSTADIGFVDAANNNLHITAGSQAVGYCNGINLFPTTDIDGDLRVSNGLDAGADEIP
jgi:hypothetical protein